MTTGVAPPNRFEYEVKTRWRVVLLVAMGSVAVASTAAQQNDRPAELAWQAIRQGPMAGDVNWLTETQPHVLLAREGNTLYRSTDDGRTWIECRRLAPASSLGLPPAGRALSIQVGDESEPEVQITDAFCESVRPKVFPAREGRPGRRPIRTLGTFETQVELYSDSVFVSADQGKTWTRPLSFSGALSPVCATTTGLSKVLLLAQQRLYRSDDYGRTWMDVPADSTGGQTAASASSANPNLECPIVRSSNWWTLYSTARGGLWRSTDEGLTWTRVLEARMSAFAATELRLSVQATATDGSQVLMLSEDEGKTWTSRPFVTERPRLYTRVMIDTTSRALIAGTTEGIFRSEDRGRSWTRTGFNRWAMTLAADRNRAYASESSRLWTSADGGATWVDARASLAGDRKPPPGVPQFARMFDTNDGTLRAAAQGTFFLSKDGGLTWQPSGLDRSVHSLARVGDIWFAGTSDGVFRSVDLSTWVECSSGLSAGSNAAGLVATESGDLIVVTSGATYRSTDRCRSWWQLTNQGASGFLFSVPGGVLALGSGIRYLDLTDRAWRQLKEETEIRVTAAAKDDRDRYWIGTPQGVYLHARDDRSWSLWPVGLDGERITSLAVDPKGYVVVAVEGRGLFRAALP